LIRAAGVPIWQDRLTAGRVQIDKANRSDEIDAVVALAMAIDRIENRPGTHAIDRLAVTFGWST
jgi:hypothetical protein